MILWVLPAGPAQPGGKWIDDRDREMFYVPAESLPLTFQRPISCPHIAGDHNGEPVTSPYLAIAWMLDLSLGPRRPTSESFGGRTEGVE